MAMSRPIAVVALMLAVASSFGCAGLTGADGRGALLRKASPTSAAPELPARQHAARGPRRASQARARARARPPRGGERGRGRRAR